MGTTKWDFKCLVMQFDFDGVQHTLQGIPPKGMKTIVGSHKLFNQSIQLYFMQMASNDTDDLGIYYELRNC